MNEEQALTAKLIDLHKKKIEELVGQEKTIEERYKKMMDEELSDITREKVRRSAIIESLSSDINIDNIKEAVEDIKTEEKKEEEEPKISDTLFPENNEDAEQPENTEELNESEENNNEDASIEIPADNVISSDEAGFDFGDGASPESSESSNSDDGWVDTPTEWN